MQQSAWPSAVTWDPAAVALPGELHEALARLADASAILLVAGPEARASGWAAGAAIALADRVASSQPCVLLDLVLDGGELHGLLGMESLEGVNDMFLYGASLRHVLQHPQDRQFEFAPAGQPGDTELVLTHRRWYRLLGEVKASAAQMLAYVPADAPGLEYLTQRIPQTVALAGPNDLAAMEARLSGLADCVVVLHPPPTETRLDAAAPVASAEEPAAPVAETPAVDPPQPPAAVTPPDADPQQPAAVAPPDADPPQPAAAVAPPAPERPPRTPPAGPSIAEPSYTRRVTDQDFEAIRLPRQGAREKRIAELRAQQRAARMSPPPAIVAPPQPAAEVDAPDAAHPPSVAQAPEPRRPPPLTEPSFVTLMPRDSVKSRSTLYIALSLVLVAALAYGMWRFFRGEPATDPAPSSPAQVAQVREQNLVPLPYAVAVEAHQRLPLAVQRVQALRAEDRNIGFYIAPIQVESVLYYRIMAGPVADSAEASALLRRLLEKGHKTGASQWDVLRSPLAFVLGEYDSRSAAEAREREAARLSIPAYVVPVPGPDGNTRQRVYAGAYAGFAEAEVMRQLLRSAGLPDSLVQRVGTRQ